MTNERNASHCRLAGALWQQRHMCHFLPKDHNSNKFGVHENSDSFVAKTMAFSRLITRLLLYFWLWNNHLAYLAWGSSLIAHAIRDAILFFAWLLCFTSKPARA